MTSEHSKQLALKSRLPRTWPAFFAQYGNFTAAQLVAIPHLLDGENVIICTPTASGKTEAVLAPLIERHCQSQSSGLRLLHIVPTRALANDLQARLAPSLEMLGLKIGVKTRDLTTFDPRNPASLLITTPESVDSLLTSYARIFINLRAIVIDEIHLFDATPRGDQLRVLLNRLRQIREYAASQGHAADDLIQYAGLSATLNDPTAIAARYFPEAKPIHIEGKRLIEAEYIALSSENAEELAAYLQTFRMRGWRKALVFCNSRADVENYAAAIRPRSPFGDAVYVHYSNIEAERRREIEEQFATNDVALCFATSTLELGIDIGSIDVVILIGPPGDIGSFTQRIGRGNRRKQKIHVACFYRTLLEELLFKIQTKHTIDTHFSDNYKGFLPAVAVQQIFSLIKQSPTGAVRLNTIASLFDDMLALEQVKIILGRLQELGYLQPGKPGEWRAGAGLNQLIDEQSSDQPSLSIYSNINITPARIEVRDQYTHRVIAQIERQWLDQPTLTLEGRAVNVEWIDGEALWVTSTRTQKESKRLIYRSGRKYLSYEMARMIPSEVGLSIDSSPLVETPTGWLWFHWLGDLYGIMLFHLIRYRIAAEETMMPGLCLFLPQKPQALFSWSEKQVISYLKNDFSRYEKMLALGAFHKLLPHDLRRQVIIEQVNVSCFLKALDALNHVNTPELITENLAELLDNA